MIFFRRMDHNRETRQGLMSLAYQHLIRIRGRLFSEKKEVSSYKVAKFHCLQASLPITTITEEEESICCSSVDSDELSLTRRKSMEVVIDMLSRSDMDCNRRGFERLTLLTKTKLHGLPCSFQISHAIVYGDDPTEGQLRCLLVSFISDDEQERCIRDLAPMNISFDPSDENNVSLDSMDEDDSSWSSLSESSEETSRLSGKAWGNFHVQALCVVANALEQILTSDYDSDPLPLNFKDSFWQRIVAALCHNIESCHSTDATGWSLKILRLLHTLEPCIVTPLLRHTLFPYIANLEIQGKLQRFPMIESEASKLMRRTFVVPPKSRIEM